MTRIPVAVILLTGQLGFVGVGAAQTVTVTPDVPVTVIGAVAPAADARSISVDAYIKRWDDLATESRMPLGRDRAAAEAKPFGQTIADSFVRYRAQLDADRVAGRKPRACPVKGSTDSFQIADLIVSLRALPAAARGGSLESGFFTYMDKRYPCTAR